MLDGRQSCTVCRLDHPVVVKEMMCVQVVLELVRVKNWRVEYCVLVKAHSEMLIADLCVA